MTDDSTQIGEALTAWEDINPPMALAQRHGQPSASLVPAGLEPATRVQFRNELTACLALVAPVGMTEEARGEWLLVAWETLKHLPADMLRAGCAKARQTADHPAKIVPIITAETADWLTKRRNGAPHAELVPPARRIEKQAPPLTDDEIKRMPGYLVRMGVKMGEIDRERAEQLRPDAA